MHLSPITGFTPRYWNAKRALGFANWQRYRKAVHQRHIAGLIVADAWEQGADHMAVTGDFINIGLPAEYEAARQWIEDAGPPERVTVIPGNHDVYTTLRRHAGIGLWGAWMEADGKTPTFPFVKRVGHLAFIGLNSAIPRRPFLASGRLGSTQIVATAKAIADVRKEGLISVVLIHHPPLPGLSTARRGLDDAFDFALMLSQEPPDLVLHGHNHIDTLVMHPASRGQVPVIGVAAASSMKPHKAEPMAHYNLIGVSGTPANPVFTRTLRGFTAVDGPIVEISTQTLRLRP